MSHRAHVSAMADRTLHLKRAEIIHCENAAGDEVFAVGSITFCESLWRSGGFDGPVSRMPENVVRGFSRPREHRTGI